MGTHIGYVHLWDAASVKRTTVFNGHSARVGIYDITSLLISLLMIINPRIISLV